MSGSNEVVVSAKVCPEIEPPGWSVVMMTFALPASKLYSVVAQDTIPMNSTWSPGGSPSPQSEFCQRPNARFAISSIDSGSRPPWVRSLTVKPTHRLVHVVGVQPGIATSSQASTPLHVVVKQ